MPAFHCITPYVTALKSHRPCMSYNKLSSLRRGSDAMGYLSVSRHQISVIPADSCRCTGHNGLYDAPFGIIQLLLLDYCI